ncbi:MAG: DUF2130 domain-containing protein [Pseudomonadota bacterium]|nr:DUF2130 domain-containing protein [Pseudomonadota bacterium]
MSNIEITCPHCQGEVELTEALAAPLLQQERAKVDELVQKQLKAERKSIEEKAAAEARQSLELKLTEQTAELQRSEEKLIQAQQLEREARKAKATADEALREQDLIIERKVEEAKSLVAKAAEDRARMEARKELHAVQEQLLEQQKQLKQAEQAEIAARKAKQDAEDAMRKVELEVSRRLDDERTKVREAAVQERDSEHRLKLAEKDQQLESMRQQIEQLRRSGNAGSQQLAGDVLEVDLTQTLSEAFPGDHFERVPKGKAGGDVIHRVVTPSGQVAGTILWESKRTKTWQGSWLGKLRDDQRDAGAEIAVIASETLPDGNGAFAHVEGVWVTGLSTVVPVAAALRQGLLETSRARLALAAADTTKDTAYTYLTGNEFTARMTRIVEAYSEMRGDLDKEKRVIAKQWAAREKQLDRVLSGIGGLYGDLQGIFGPSLPEVKKLSLSSLDAEQSSPLADNKAAGTAKTTVELED